MSIDTKIKFIPLSFINTHEELKRQVINTTIWSYYAKSSEPDVLGNLLESTQYGYTASASDVGSHKLLRITDILNGSVTWEQVPYCDCNKGKEYLLKAGDILVARTGGTTGKSFLVKDVPNNAVFASYLIRLRAKDKKYERIIYSLMNSYLFWSQITELKSGSAQPNVNAEKLKKILIPKISDGNLSEIIEILNGNFGTNKELQNKIMEVENNLNKLEEISSEIFHQDAVVSKLRQSILQDAIQGKLVEQDLHDEPASELLKKIIAEKEKLIAAGKLKKEKPLPQIEVDEMPFQLPTGWAWCRLGAISNYGSSPKAEPKALKNDTWVLDLEDIEKETSVLLKKVRFGERKSLSTKSVFEKDDVLYSKLRPYLDKVIVADEAGVCTTEILPIKCYGGIDPQFFRLTLKSKDFLNYVNSVTKGMKMPRLGTKEGQRSLLPLAPTNEQKRIVQKIFQRYEQLSMIKNEVIHNRKKAQDLMQAVLQEAFN